MKVLVISNLFPNRMEPHRGIFVYHQVKEMLDQGHEVRVVAPVPWAHRLVKNRSERWKKLSQIPEKDIWEGVPVHYTRYLVPPGDKGFSYYGWLYYLGMKEQIERWRREGFDFDIIHCHVALPGGYAGMLLGQKYKKPMVVTVHGQDVTTSIFRGPSVRRAVIRVLESAQYVVTVSNMLKKKILEVLPQDKKIKLVYNGVPWVLPSSVQKKEADGGDITVLSVGNLIPRKAHDITMKAFAQICRDFPGAKLKIVGDGKERDKLEKLVKELQLGDRISLEGRKAPEQVMDYMKDCDIFVLPSWDEGFGVVYLEAMAHGKPIIGCSGEGVADIIEDGKNGFLVPSHHVDALAQALRVLMGDKNLRMQTGEAGRKTVEASFLWRQKVMELVDIYQQAVENYKSNSKGVQEV